jgi:hypothetical protein
MHLNCQWSNASLHTLFTIRKMPLSSSESMNATLSLWYMGPDTWVSPLGLPTFMCVIRFDYAFSHSPSVIHLVIWSINISMVSLQTFSTNHNLFSFCTMTFFVTYCTRNMYSDKLNSLTSTVKIINTFLKNLYMLSTYCPRFQFRVGQES